MEPSPVLIAPFQVHVRGGARFGRCFQDGGMADAGIEPDVEDVRLFPEDSPRRIGAAGSRGQQVARLPLEPDVGAVLPDERRPHGQDLLRHDLAVARLAVEHGDRHAPDRWREMHQSGRFSIIP